MGVYLCLNDTSIHNVNIESAISFDTLGSLENIHETQTSFIFFSKAIHKIKRKRNNWLVSEQSNNTK